MMKNSYITLLLSILLIFTFSACEFDQWDTCDDCYYDEPVEGEFFLVLNHHDIPVDSIYLVLKKGLMESDDTIYSGYAYDQEQTFWLEVKQGYTGIAYYPMDNGDTIRVVNYAKLKSSSMECTDDYETFTCWALNNPELDLKLKVE